MESVYEANELVLAFVYFALMLIAGEAGFRLGRQACPAVSANLNLQLSQEQISLSYLKVNPGPIAEGQEHQYLSVIFRFEVGEYDGPYLVVPFGENSKTLHTPDQLAQYIMELLFIV